MSREDFRIERCPACGQHVSMLPWHRCARALIRNGWVLAQRDGMYDETQTYVLRPVPKGAFR